MSDDITVPPGREKWDSRLDFILSCIGFAVGLGNVLRFPYLVGRNGGAAFLIPYFTMMVFTGLPAFYMESALGQYGQVTPMYLYKRMSPFFTGVGYTMVMISVFTGVYYNMYLAWIFRYFYDSVLSLFGGDLPWDTCRHFDDNHLNQLYFDTCQNDKACPTHVMPSWKNYTVFRNNCYNDTEFKRQMSDVTFKRAFTAANKTGFDTAAATYFNYVFGYDKTTELFEEWGMPKWDIVIALAVAWILVFLVLVRGVKTTGKIVYFTATFPYVLLLILLIIGQTLDGSEIGIEFYLSPKWEKLLDYTIWSDAAQQIFYSCTVGGGGLTTLSSYNKFSNNLMRDTFIVIFGNCTTSFFVGFVVFSIMGFVSKRTEIPIEKLALQGPALAFTSYPDAIAHVPQPAVGKILGVAFFFMMILLAIDSQLVVVEVVVTAVEDTFPRLSRSSRSRATIVFIVCFLSFLAGLVLCTKSGPPLLALMDTAAGGWTLLIAVLFELAFIAYIYGIRRFVADIRMMLGNPPNRFWKFIGYPVNAFWMACWTVITPSLLTLVLVLLFIDFGKGNFLKYNGKTYPPWGVALGIGMTSFVVMWIPIFMLVTVYKATFMGKGWSWLFASGEKWGPEDAAIREMIAQKHPYHDKMFPTSVSNPGYDVQRAVEQSPVSYDGNQKMQTRDTSCITSKIQMCMHF